MKLEKSGGSTNKRFHYDPAKTSLPLFTSIYFEYNVNRKMESQKRKKKFFFIYTDIENQDKNFF